MKDALFLARKDASHLLRTGPTILWTFVMPIVFFYFIGTITSGSSNADAKDPLAVSVPSDAGFLADQLIARLEARDYRVVRTKTPEEFARYAPRLAVPSGFTDSVLAGPPLDSRLPPT